MNVFARKRGLLDEGMTQFARKRARPCGEGMVKDTDNMESKAWCGQYIPPLLRLPAELRNQIYALVLGGQNLHVYARNENSLHHSARVTFYICEQPLHHHRNTPISSPSSHESQESVQPLGLQPEWLAHHLPCFGTLQPLHSIPNSSFLATCSQIYHEARLIPYASNRFNFITPSSFETFVTKALSAPQAKAVRSIGVWAGVCRNAGVGWDWEGDGDAGSTWKGWSPQSGIREAGLLDGIQEVRVWLSIYGDVGDGTNGEWRDVRGIRGIMELGRLDLRRVEVRVTGSAVGKGEQEFAEEIKGRLLGTWEDVDVAMEDSGE